MAAIYEMELGTIVSENSGIRTIENHDKLPEYSLTLQPVPVTSTPAKTGPCDEYMSIIRELLKDL
jgi:hypothetical protein